VILTAADPATDLAVAWCGYRPGHAGCLVGLQRGGGAEFRAPATRAAGATVGPEHAIMFLRPIERTTRIYSLEVGRRHLGRAV